MTILTSAAGAAPKRTFIGSALYALRLIAVNFLVFAIMAELVSVVLVHRKSWPSSRPTYRLNYNEFWADINPAFGVWHRPNGHFFTKVAASASNTRRIAMARATKSAACIHRNLAP